jgi:hypothetical protein
MPRFYVGHTENEKEIWKATNAAAEGNFLITIELSDDDPKSAERHNTALAALGQDAASRRQLSQHVWIFALESRLNDVFQGLVDHLGIEHHSYTAVDLKCGEGLSYDRQKRVVCEFYSANWVA